MLDLKALEKALSVIGNLGKGEFTFTVDNVPVTMRVLTADEDLAVQRYARDAADESGKDDDGSALTVLERFKRATLGFSIVQVGSTDLRNEEFIATGEVTDKNVPVKMPKHLAVRKLVDGWTRTATLALFQKYLELVRRVDAEAEKAVLYNPTDLDAEITRVEKRLEELKREKERATSLNTASSSQVASVAAVDQSAVQNFKNIAERAASVQSPLSTQKSPEVPSEPSTPVTVQAGIAPSPSVEVRPPPTPPAPAPAAVRQRVMPAEAPPPPRPVPPRPAPPEEPPSEGDFGGMLDSLGDSPEAIAAETARIQAARASARRASMDVIQADASDVLPAGPGRRTPPHRAAAHADSFVVDMGGGSIEAARPTSGPVEGVETYRLAPSTVVDRGQRPNPNTRVPVDSKPKTGANNPRFKPPGR